MVRMVNAEEFFIARKWFKEQTGATLIHEVVGTRNFMYYKDDLPIASISLLVDCNLAFLVWPIANPSASPESRSEALNALIEKVTEHAHTLGCKWVSTWSSVPAVESRLLQHGFVIADTPVTQLIKKLGEY